MVVPSDVAACADPENALAMAGSLMSRLPQRQDNAYWLAQSRILLSGYLLAAALGDDDMDTVLAWTADPENRRALKLLRCGPAPQ
ncbi:hypothetical protein K7B10_40150 [Streptomyces flavotricini]|uniref:Uncharacterized protein n=1 Tax=Streptomyces flavotricini TaxID=66888 RepID=A0ABS8EIT0_9ACTN|nr:hypothetical protein [Streptomyces flavotricini]MCC0100853.1 hypothetical protein [Streptomyces flavotricini]